MEASLEQVSVCISLLFSCGSQGDINIQEGKQKVKCKPLTSKEAIQHLPTFTLLLSEEKNISFFPFIMQINQPKPKMCQFSGARNSKRWELGNVWMECQGCRAGAAQGQEQWLTLNPCATFSWEVFWAVLCCSWKCEWECAVFKCGFFPPADNISKETQNVVTLGKLELQRKEFVF